MKRYVRTMLFLLLTVCALTGTAFADMGPKEQLVVKVIHPPAGAICAGSSDRTCRGDCGISRFYGIIKRAVQKRAAVYGIAANAASAAIGWLISQPVWEFVVSIS